MTLDEICTDSLDLPSKMSVLLILARAFLPASLYFYVPLCNWKLGFFFRGECRGRRAVSQVTVDALVHMDFSFLHLMKIRSEGDCRDKQTKPQWLNCPRTNCQTNFLFSAINDKTKTFIYFSCRYCLKQHWPWCHGLRIRAHTYRYTCTSPLSLNLLWSRNGSTSPTSENWWPWKKGGKIAGIHQFIDNLLWISRKDTYRGCMVN